MQITGGKVTYLRSVQPAQYESKKCEVEISFTLGEGEVLGNQLDIAAKAAVDKVHEVVGLKAAMGAPKVATAPKNPTPPPADPKADAAANMTAREQKAHAQANKGPKTPPSTGAAISTGGERKPSDDGLDFDLVPSTVEAPASAPITDKDLTAAVNKKHGELAKVLKDAAAPKVRACIADFAGALPKQLRDIPADKRAEFLVALAALKAE